MTQNNLPVSFEDTITSLIDSYNVTPELFRDGVMLCNLQSKIMAVSETLCTLFGYAEEFLLKAELPSLLSYAHRLCKDTSLQYTTSVHTANGDIPVIVYQKKIQPNQHALYLLIFQQKTDRPFPTKSYFLAQFPNRFLFLYEMLQLTLNYNCSHNVFSALLLLDIDHFKAINHVHGYNVGDLLLTFIANKIASIVSSSQLEHLNGDEFAILVKTHSSNYTEAEKEIKTMCNTLLHTIRQPICLDKNTFFLTASIGVVPFKDGYTNEQIVQYADSALYEAKKAGRNISFFFSPIIQDSLEQKAILLNKLQQALKRQEMFIVYQKQWGITSSEDMTIVGVTGVEALVRWKCGTDGIIPPDQFIPLAEESGLIVPLGTWILEQTFKQLKAWENDPIKAQWRLSINISVKQFEKDDFIPTIQHLLSTVQCDPTHIRFELTESLLIKNLKSSLKKAKTLQKFGISLSIDDFGTGYSSLAYLKRLPIHELKIDKTFIRDIMTDPADVVLVQTILGIGKRFALDVIAEGVETKEQFELLHQLGCQYFQGYYFSRPVQISDL